MNDLEERLRGIDRLTLPELWDAAQAKARGGTAANRLWGARRIAVIAAALALGLGAVGWVIASFRPSSTPAIPADGSTDGPLAALEIVVRWTTNPVDLHIAATYQGEEVDLVGIETPGPDLEYPKAAPMELPVGTPIHVETEAAGDTVSVFQLLPAQGRFVVENGSCIVPGSLRGLPGPGSSAFFILVEGNQGAGGQAFLADMVGGSLDHDAAIDGDPTVDANLLGFTVCGVPHILASSFGPSGDQALLTGTLEDVNGCLAVGNGPSSVYVVWPQGYRLAAEGDDVWLIDDAGSRVAKIGDEVRMGGGVTNLADVEPHVPGGVPPSCQVGGPDAYWFAGTPKLADKAEL